MIGLTIAIFMHKVHYRTNPLCILKNFTIKKIPITLDKAITLLLKPTRIQKKESGVIFNECFRKLIYIIKKHSSPNITILICYSMISYKNFFPFLLFAFVFFLFIYYKNYPLLKNAHCFCVFDTMFYVIQCFVKCNV